MYDGLFLIDKQPDCTSHDVVQQVRRILRQRKIGHCGTLDPGATGLLVLTLGRATRLTRFLIRAPKIYEGDIRFGITTDTFDRHGQTTAESSIDQLQEAAVETAMNELIGTFEQAAPPFSAKKFRGVKYYEMARRGEEVPEAKKVITVFDFIAMGPLRDGCLGFRLECSSGTYVRSLAHDLGQSLGCGAHLAELRRIKVGPFHVDDAVSLQDLSEQAESEIAPRDGWVPLDRIPLPFQEMATDSQQAKRIVHGQSVLFRDLEGEEGDWVKLVDRRGQLLAVGTVAERIGSGKVGLVQPRIVFGS
jgi:tRNA pseudouridine55 synthase